MNAHTSQPSCGEFGERLSCPRLTGPPAAHCPPHQSDTQPLLCPPVTSISSVWPDAQSGTPWGLSALAKSQKIKQGALEHRVIS